MSNRITHKLDVTATNVVCAGNAAVPVPNWDVQTAPGVDKPQLTTENGVPVWVLDGLLDDGSDRANVIGIRVASPVQPEVKRFQPLAFSSLTLTAYVNRKSGQLTAMYEGELATASGRRTGSADQAA